MTMFNYLFPIFAFGLVMTGIVFLGLLQASDMAKNLAAERSEAESKSSPTDVVSPRRNSAPIQVPTRTSRP